MSYNIPVRVYGCTRLCVKEFAGAVGDGVTDDTAAFQKAVDTLPKAGGTVHVPAGKYLIDPVVSVKLRSNMLFQMDPGAELIAKPNSSIRYFVLVAQNCDNVEIAGGKITGDRDQHNYVTAGLTLKQQTHEWGMGIGIRSSTHVTVRDISISDCTGDGVCVTGNDVVLSNVISDNNRRQALSITTGSNVSVYECELMNTIGTSPECGIDVEPDLPGTMTNVWIEACKIHGNNKYGINVWKNSGNVTIKNCEINDNVCGVVTYTCSNVKIIGNYIHNQKATGVFIQDYTSGYLIDGNTFKYNYSKQGLIDRTDFTQTGWSSKIQKDILLKATATGTVGTNNYQ